MSAGLLAFHECFIEAERSCRGRAVRKDEATWKARSRSITIHHGRERETSYVEHPSSRVDISIHSLLVLRLLGQQKSTTRKKKKDGASFPFLSTSFRWAIWKNGAIVAVGGTGRVTTANDKLSPYYSRNASGWRPPPPPSVFFHFFSANEWHTQNISKRRHPGTWTKTFCPSIIDNPTPNLPGTTTTTKKEGKTALLK